MDIMIFLILASLFVGLVFLAAFFWALKSGQMEDLYTPALRVVIDEDSPKHTQHSGPEAAQESKG